MTTSTSENLVSKIGHPRKIYQLFYDPSEMSLEANHNATILVTSLLCSAPWVTSKPRRSFCLSPLPFSWPSSPGLPTQAQSDPLQVNLITNHRAPRHNLMLKSDSLCLSFTQTVHQQSKNQDYLNVDLDPISMWPTNYLHNTHIHTINSVNQASTYAEPQHSTMHSEDS